MKIIKENHILDVTEKSYRVIYKDLGYESLEDDAQEEHENTEEGAEQTEEESTEEFKTIGDSMTIKELRALAEQRGIKVGSRVTKPELLAILGLE